MTLSRAFRRGELSPSAWRGQIKELSADRLVLEESRDLAGQQLEAAETVAESFEDVEAEIADLRTRIKKADKAHRKAIIAALVPDHQPYGIVVSPDGEITIRGAIPYREKVVDQNSLRAQES